MQSGQSSASRGQDPAPSRLKRKEVPEEITVRRATLVRLCEALEEIRARMQNQIYWLHEAVAERALRWRCLDCGELHHFTNPKAIGTVIPCPKCQSDRAEPLA